MTRSSLSSLSARLTALVISLSVATPLSVAHAATPAPEFDAPSGLALAGGHLWVTNAASNSLTEIDPANGALVATFASPGFGFSHPSALAAAGGDLFVANANATVTELRASDGTLVRRIVGGRYHFFDPVSVATQGANVLVLKSGAAGSITELSASTGALVRVIRGAAYAFDHPAAFVVSGRQVWVADMANNSVTEVDAVTAKLLHVVAGQGLSTPDGIAVARGHVWVADMASSAVTELAQATAAVLATKTDSDASYGFGSPTLTVAALGNIYVASPMGSSPMVTKFSATTGSPSWYMCNTNGPYYFSSLSAFAVSGDQLWVASRDGANSKTPGAATGSLTELALGTGALTLTLPRG